MKLSDFEDGRMLLTVARMIYTTETITVTSDGWAVVTGMGGGAGGCKSYFPGNSAPWGVKAFAVSEGDVVAFSIGAGGAAVTVTNTPAAAGGSSVITLNGQTMMTCQGGDAGPGTTLEKSPVVAKVVGADYWARGRQPQCATGAVGPFPGAAVDLGAGTYNASTNTGDHAVDVTGGLGGVGVLRGYHFWPFDIMIVGTSANDPGVGAIGANAISTFFGGGSGFNDASVPGMPGRGGSAGRAASSVNPRPGGAGLGFLRLYKTVN